MMARLHREQARSTAERERHVAELSAEHTQRLERERDYLQREAHEDTLTCVGNRRAAGAALARLMQDRRASEPL